MATLRTVTIVGIALAACNVAWSSAAASTAAPAGDDAFADRFTEKYDARVRELMALTGETERLIEAMRAVGEGVEEGYGDFYRNVAETMSFDDAADRSEFLAREAERARAFRETLIADLDAEFEQLAFDSAVQVYRELYTPADLKALVRFLKTPVGRKFYESHSDRMKQTLRYAQGQAIHLVRDRLPTALESERRALAPGISASR